MDFSHEYCSNIHYRHFNRAAYIYLDWGTKNGRILLETLVIILKQCFGQLVYY